MVSTLPVILLADDNPDVAQAIQIALAVKGYRLEVATTPAEAYSKLAQKSYDAILLDLNFSPGKTTGEEGFACLTRILSDYPTASVIVITAHSGVRIAVAAMQAGARDFIMKPWRNAELVEKIEAVLKSAAARTDRLSTSSTLRTPARLLGESEAIDRIRNLVRQVGPTEAGVLISGNPGSGRMLTARSIYEASTRADELLSIIDVRDRDSWETIPVGRATLVLRNPDLLDSVEQERLASLVGPGIRSLAVVERPHLITPVLRALVGTIDIEVPALSERGSDPLILARHFARVAAERHGRRLPTFSASAESFILKADWPGQVRDIALAIERAVVLNETGLIDQTAFSQPDSARETPETQAVHGPKQGDHSLRKSERAIIEAALRDHHHNVTHAAAALGVSRGALYRRMARYGL